MASSGTFTGSRGGSSTGPYLKLAWSVIDTDIAANKSQVRLTLSLVADYAIYFSADKSGSLDGTSFTYTSGMSGSGTKTIKTLDKWFTHASDGSLSVTLDGRLDIEITYSSYISSLSVSGTAVLDDIPRASGFTAFSLSNSVLNTSTAVTVNYTLDRKSSGFSQLMTLKYGSKVIKSWTTTGTGALTQALSTTEVNSIISAMSTVTSGTLTLTMQTKSGSTNIGSVVSRTASITLNAAIKPTASALTVSIYGTGKDKTLNQYIQNISKVTASFTDAAGYGATIKSTTIVVKRSSDGGNSQTISGDSGTTAGVLTLSGTYSVTGTVTDSRGRTATVSTTITVTAYTAPTIVKFSAARDSVTTSNVNATINATWSPMGTGNPATITVIGTNNAGVATTLYTLSNSTAGALNTNQIYTAQSDASAYSYTLKIVDSFGKEASATVKIGTTFVEITISKGKGVGIGKVHEKGSLDVKGDFYLEGTIHMAPNSYRNNPNAVPGLNANNGDIYGLNGIWFGDGGDTANNNGEGLLFPKSTTPAGSILYSEWDNLRVNDGRIFLNSEIVASAQDRVLWNGAGWYMTGSQTVPLAGDKAITNQPNGWIFVWSDYSSQANNFNFVYTFVHKDHVVSWNGLGMYHMVPNTTDASTTKYTYVYTDKVTGNDENNATTGRANVVLRKVLGW